MDKIFERFKNEIQTEYSRNQDMLEQVIYQKQEELTKKSNSITERENTIIERDNTIKLLNTLKGNII